MNVLGLLILIAVMALGITKCQSTLGGAGGSELNMPLPPFKIPNVMNPQTNFTDADMRGHVGLLIVWGSWCPACRSEHAMLMEIQNKAHVPLYGVAVNDNPLSAKKYLDETGDPFVESGVDVNDVVARNLDLTAVPTVYIVDKQGIVRYRFLGAISDTTWAQILAPLIEQYEGEK